MTFRSLVERELLIRRTRNPRYSLRAFALALGADHSTLSQIIRGRRRATTRVIRSLGPKIGMHAADIEAACAVENDDAVLLAIARPAFRPDTRWIATVAGITIDEVNVALQRLLYRGAIAMSARNEWRVL